MSAEIYDPATGHWSATGSMGMPRLNHVAVRLPNGKVLVTGGDRGSPPRNRTNSAELYDLDTGVWSNTGNLITRRELQTATLLADGKVLVVGGSGPGNNFDAIASAEVYDPSTGIWSSAGTMSLARSAHTAMLSTNGQVLVASGAAGTSTSPVLPAGAEIYNPATGGWTPTGNLNVARLNHAATLLTSGKVLVVSGQSVTTSTEIFDGGGPIVATVSAASYSFQTAPKGIVAAFGQNFSTSTAVTMTVPLPTSLAGVMLKVRDGSGTERIAPLFFVSPNQINYQIPSGALLGQADITVTAGDGSLINGVIQIISAEPRSSRSTSADTCAVAALDAFTGAGGPFNATRAGGEPNIISASGQGWVPMSPILTATPTPRSKPESAVRR
jgi:uncharacterized protein (TIGR03437 family)